MILVCKSSLHILKAVFRNFPQKANVNMAHDHNYHDALHEKFELGKSLLHGNQESCVVKLYVHFLYGMQLKNTRKLTRY